MAIKSFRKGKRILENNLAIKMNIPFENFSEGYDKEVLKEGVFDNEEVK